MSQAEALYRLQSIDLEISDKARRRREMEASLGETEELRVARARVVQVEAALQELRKTLRVQELEVKGLTAKIKEEEKKLYGGRIRNPKELAGLEEEVAYLRRSLAAMEDEMLETLLQIEEEESRLAAVRGHLRQVEVAWGDEQTRLRREMEALARELEELREERENALLYVTGENLRLYDGLRRAKGGRAVALLEGNLCRGCLVTLPTSEAQRARRGDALVYCSNCGRILYARG